MKYYILKHTAPSMISKFDTPWICRVMVEDCDANILNEVFESYVSSGCYRSYKVMSMTKDQFDKGTVTQVHTLETLPKYINAIGYYPY